MSLREKVEAAKDVIANKMLPDTEADLSKEIEEATKNAD